MPGGIRSIGERAFGSCKNLESIKLPDGVAAIGGGAFEDCRRLKHIRIPDSVMFIGEGAFDSCEKITICAPVGSYAERYAKENKIPFVAE